MICPMIDLTDRKMLEILQRDGRISNAALAQELHLSPSPCLRRLRALERDGVITGYTIVLGETAEHPGVSAHVLLTLDPKFQDRAMAALKGLPEVSSCYTVSGVYDAVAMVRASTSAHLDEVLTRIGRLPGITRTTSAILLSTMFERG